jgi:hypothetical protein
MKVRVFRGIDRRFAQQVDPGKGENVGDGQPLAFDEGPTGEMLLEQGEAGGRRGVDPGQGVGVAVELAHRAGALHRQKHIGQPAQPFGQAQFFGGVMPAKFAGLFGQIGQNNAGFRQRSPAMDQRRHAPETVDRQIVRRLLLPVAQIDVAVGEGDPGQTEEQPDAGGRL